MPESSHINTRADIIVIPIVAVLGEIMMPVVVLRFVLGRHCRHFQRNIEGKQIEKVVTTIQQIPSCQYDELFDTQ